MADTEALRRLVEGASAWNEFRRASPCGQDLSHIEIRNASYRGANFAHTDFDGSIFSYVDFSGCNFHKARLNGVSASHTTFARSDLKQAELKGSDLKHASLRGCDLRGADGFAFKVRHCDLTGIDLAGAALLQSHVYNSDLREADLRDARLEGLILKRVVMETERMTELRSKGLVVHLPNEPHREKWIDWQGFDAKGADSHLPLVVYRDRAYWINEGRWDFFISHTGADKEAVARPLAGELRRRGLRIWFDELECRIGDDLARVIDYGTSGSLFGVVILSKPFFGRRWTEEELAALLRKRVFLVLHGITPEDVRTVRPELGDYRFGRSEIGIQALADELVDAIRVPPRAEPRPAGDARISSRDRP